MILYMFTWEIGKFFNYSIEPVEKLGVKDLLAPMRFEKPKDYLKNRRSVLANLRGDSWVVKNRHFHEILNRFDKGIPTQD